jgi:hypothetical protein
MLGLKLKIMKIARTRKRQNLRLIDQYLHFLKESHKKNKFPSSFLTNNRQPKDRQPKDQYYNKKKNGGIY